MCCAYYLFYGHNFELRNKISERLGNNLVGGVREGVIGFLDSY